jgi:hypothetical protein
MSIPIAADRAARLADLLTRPDFLEELQQRITDGETLVEACKAWNVPYGRVASWIGAEDHPERAEAYRVALRIRADALIAEAVKIAGETQAGETVKKGPDGTVTTTEDMLGHRKLRIETHFKAAAKWDPARFGDSQRVELTAKVLKPNEVTIIEGARRMAFHMARGAQLLEQKRRREPRLLEATASRVPAAPEVEEGDV